MDTVNPRGMLADYTTYLRAAGRGPLTIDTRTGQARRLCAALDPLTATERDLLAYLAHPDWKPATRASERAGVRGFMGWLVFAGLRADDPSRRLPAVRVPPPCPHPAPEDALARARADACTPWEACMVELCARAGLRRAEVAALRFSDVQDTPSGPVLRITGKGQRTRVVPIPAELAEQVRALEPEYVFPGRSPGTHMAPNHVGEVLSRLLGPVATAHSLRHRYATRCYAASGHDLLLVSRLMGHTSCVTTQGYIGADEDDARRAVVGAA